MNGFKGFIFSLLAVILLVLAVAPPHATAVAPRIPDLPRELRSANKVVLVDFFATWCSTCQSMKPFVESLHQEYGSKLQLIHIDVDNTVNQKYVRLYAVSGTPTYILFNPQGKALYKTEESFSPMSLKSQIIKATTQVKECTKSC